MAQDRPEVGLGGKPSLDAADRRPRKEEVAARSTSIGDGIALLTDSLEIHTTAYEARLGSHPAITLARITWRSHGTGPGGRRDPPGRSTAATGRRPGDPHRRCVAGKCVV